MALAPHGGSVVVGSQEGIRVLSWPELQGKRRINPASDHVHDLAFSPSGLLLAAAGGRPGEYGEITVYRWPQGSRVTSTLEHDDEVYGITWLSENRLATGAADNTLRTWTMEVDTIRMDARYEGHSRRILAVAYLPEPGLLLSAAVDQSVRVWNAAEPKLVRSLGNHTDVVNDLAVQPRPQGLALVASCSRDRTLRLWQPQIGRLVRFSRLDTRPISVAWSNDGRLLAATCTDGSIRIVDPITVKEIARQPLSDRWVQEVTAGPDPNEFIVGLPNGQVRRVVFDGSSTSRHP